MFLLLLIAIAGSSFLAVEAVRATAPPQSGSCFPNPPRHGASTSGMPEVHLLTALSGLIAANLPKTTEVKAGADALRCSRALWWSVVLDLAIRIGACALGA
jgi:hypothetical protein